VYGDRQVAQHDGRIETGFDIADVTAKSARRRRTGATVPAGVP